MAEKKKKGLFGKAVDAFSSRDEKEQVSELEAELAKAKKEASASKEAIKTLLDKNVKDRTGAGKEAKEAEKKIADLENKLKARGQKDRTNLAEAHKRRKDDLKAKMAASMKPKLLATHKVAAGETLSHVALKYYKHATPPYWKFLLEHNKELLKGDEKSLRTGMELDIPELPAELKD